MYLLLVILMVIASILMCFIVLIQNSKGGGLASGFSSSNQIMGVRKTTDFWKRQHGSRCVFGGDECCFRLRYPFCFSQRR